MKGEKFEAELNVKIHDLCDLQQRGTPVIEKTPEIHLRAGSPQVVSSLSPIVRVPSFDRLLRL